ncbi:MAG TPA: ATP-dependent protease subunit HslV [Candidatus Sumerlaeota bacterium]|nr:ATP-dependent protease subunit HslV [Candidatus Sumerlaeota bacterium]HOR28979.1 ATP-dependent protease subunit HslV [Candidatus Sumerlaeota bacterium]HPK03292.1 ATP-dependent protease subunit HslV [Candidatus Sumerlaeota bacterium]
MHAPEPTGATFHGTTIVAVRKDGKTCVGGDGQVTFNHQILKAGARKVRRLHGGQVLVGFAGATADAMTLFEKLEAKLQEHGGNLQRAAVELAKEWRTDRYLRRLEAMLIAADQTSLFLISGNGDVLEPDSSVIAIGSGGGYALAAARALMDRAELDAEAIVRRAMEIAAELCIYTNDRIVVETL